MCRFFESILGGGFWERGFFRKELEIFGKMFVRELEFGD